ncbi:alpha/beta hydrolase [Curvibacter sp. HBC61]|uniref:Alpha/beta hydrolase n=1 Tax=Curvibacter cyanobacteriorum TaxID=3026422 RepID=A0ABT5MWS0_9BURK|nr:alpha/beta hydrolase [Curvibacter sp. HBC61]MDD0837741.1 alpha/beta hydrolase [Curvibacter sp. HBC61]
MSAPATVVLLPGLLCDEAVWADQLTGLGERPCVVPDYGTRSSITDMATHVLAAVPAERLCVAGHSMGGRVALEMVRLAPERIERLALLDTGVTPRPEGPDGLAEEQQRLALLALARAEGMATMARRWAVGMVHPERLNTPLFEDIVAMVARKSTAVFAAQIQALLGRPDARPVLAQWRGPTLLLCGRQDSWSPLARHEQMQALAPQSRLVVIEDSGHMSPQEQPAAVTGALRRWLEQTC